MALLVYLVLFLAFTYHSSALYCICKDGVSDQTLQKAIDYACGTGADCTPILQNGACYQPNTVKDHCNYAVNSYYQRKGNAPGTCDFAGAATTNANPPTTSSGCVYPSSPSNAGTTPSTVSPPGTTPSTGGTTPTFAISPTSTTGINNANGASLKPTNNTKLLLLFFVLTLWLAMRV
ncbi:PLASMODESMATA CALLOSE-BINDING PROTEIN 3 [Glycine soja]|nr:PLASMODESMATA CALLOSE-BINDING PROTEIN 3 [Glycine max]